MTREVLSRREFLHSSAGVVVAGSASLAGLVGEPPQRSGSCQLRITFSGLCYLCTPQGTQPSCCALLPRAGQKTAGQYGVAVTALHQAGLYYDLAQEDPTVPSGQIWVRHSLERWWLDVPTFGSGSTPPTLPQNNFVPLQKMFGVGPALTTVLPPAGNTNPKLPLNVASHVSLREGAFDNSPPFALWQVNGQQYPLAYDVAWTSAATNAPVQGIWVRPYPEVQGSAYQLPSLTPLNGAAYVDVYVLNVPADEQPGWPPQPYPGDKYCALHYAAFYDLVTDTPTQVGSPSSPNVPCNPKQIGFEHPHFGSPYTCMISGGG